MKKKKEAKIAKALLRNARISFKHALVICKTIKKKKVEKAKRFLENLIAKKVSLKGKYYTKAATKILKVLESAEANAKNNNLDIKRLFVKEAKANKGERFIRPKSRAKFRGRRAKSTHIEIILKEI